MNDLNESTFDNGRRIVASGLSGPIPDIGSSGNLKHM